MAIQQSELRGREGRAAGEDVRGREIEEHGSQASRLALLIGGGALAVLGGGLVYWGATMKGDPTDEADLGGARDSTGHVGQLGIKVDRSITIDRPLEEIYSFWRNFENLSKFMNHVESVQVLDDTRSHWVVKAPAGTSVEWDAVIHHEVPGEIIAWRSIGTPDVDNAGSVNFRRAPGGRGTEVHVKLQYDPPGGRIGSLVAMLFGEEPSLQVEEDLRRLKTLMEVGESPTTEGQPSGRRS